MKHKIFQADAFTNKPFSGNPACVVLLEHERPDIWMQSVASEMNLSETAFITGKTSPFDLRWFTPAVEVELCGHATLASAHILYETEIAEKDERIDAYIEHMKGDYSIDLNFKDNLDKHMKENKTDREIRDIIWEVCDG